jgi:D-cysteine desulfhydrase
MGCPNPLFEAVPAAAGQIPWMPLATLPTPVDELPVPAGGQGRLFVKRDDLTSPLYGGNKVRKFEYLLADAKRRGARTLVALGGIGSNQGLAVALHGRAEGFAVELSLAWQPVTDDVRRNLRGMIAAGARLHYATTTLGAVWNASLVARSLRRTGAAPYVLPLGATSALGSLGYVAAALELAGQVRDGLLPEPDRIFVAAGTCGTAAGLAVGCRLAGLRSRVMAVRIAERAFTNTPLLLWQAHRVAGLLATIDRPAPRIRIGWRDVTLISGYAGARYGASTPAAQAAIEWAAPRLTLETTYTGKALAACLDACRKAGQAETILFWNTFNSAPFALARASGLAEAPLRH